MARMNSPQINRRARREDEGIGTDNGSSFLGAPEAVTTCKRRESRKGQEECVQQHIYLSPREGGGGRQRSPGARTAEGATGEEAGGRKSRRAGGRAMRRRPGRRWGVFVFAFGGGVANCLRLRCARGNGGGAGAGRKRLVGLAWCRWVGRVDDGGSASTYLPGRLVGSAR